MIGLGTLAKLGKSGLGARSLRMATLVRDLIRKSQVCGGWPNWGYLTLLALSLRMACCSKRFNKEMIGLGSLDRFGKSDTGAQASWKS